MTTISIFFLGLFVCLFVMFISWLISQKLNYYSLVDVVWSYGIGLVSIIFACVSSGALSKKLIAVTLALFWSIRLGTHLAIRLKSHFPIEDSRYSGLKEKWSKSKFLFFFLFQGVSQVLFSLPFLLLAQDPESAISGVSILGISIFAVGFVGESVADSQLNEFRLRPENKVKVCDVGLWKYSRHPNYFFEWVIWCGAAIAVMSSPSGYFAFVSPMLMFLTLNFLTGVPAAEEQSLKSKGALYAEYQKKTNRFFPGLPL